MCSSLCSGRFQKRIDWSFDTEYTSYARSPRESPYLSGHVDSHGYDLVGVGAFSRLLRAGSDETVETFF